MSDTKLKYTERDLILAKREAYAVGAMVFRPEITDENRVGIEACAKTRYPLPKVERPRVVRDPHYHVCYWRAVGRSIQWKDDHDGWNSKPTFDPTPERVALWADLLANHTELVDDE